jgi:hypothetical protein
LIINRVGTLKLGTEASVNDIDYRADGIPKPGWWRVSQDWGLGESWLKVC